LSRLKSRLASCLKKGFSSEMTSSTLESGPMSSDTVVVCVSERPDRDGTRIIYRLGRLLLSEHEKLFGSYWRQVFGPRSSLMHVMGTDLSVRVSNSLSGRNRPRIRDFLLFSLFITHVYSIISLSLTSFTDIRVPILSPRLEYYLKVSVSRKSLVSWESVLSFLHIIY